MNKVIFLSLSLIISMNMFCMNIQPNISIPTTFKLETIIKTALDKVTISGIARTATYLAGIGLFSLAANDWARAAKPFPDDAHSLGTDDEQTKIKNGRLKSALHYFVGGCAFTAAGLLHAYRNEIFHAVKSLFQGKPTCA